MDRRGDLPPLEREDPRSDPPTHWEALEARVSALERRLNGDDTGKFTVPELHNQLVAAQAKLRRKLDRERTEAIARRVVEESQAGFISRHGGKLLAGMILALWNAILLWLGLRHK